MYLLIVFHMTKLTIYLLIFTWFMKDDEHKNVLEDHERVIKSAIKQTVSSRVAVVLGDLESLEKRAAMDRLIKPMGVYRKSSNCPPPLKKPPSRKSPPIEKAPTLELQIIVKPPLLPYIFELEPLNLKIFAI